MIQANELRIGNLITSKQWRGYHKISGIEVTETGYKVLVKGFWHECEDDKYFDIDSIPLTQEILEKIIWFNQTDETTFEFECTADYIIESQEDWWYIGVKSENSTNYFAWEIRYVHQLQNLCFAITNTELEINI